METACNVDFLTFGIASSAGWYSAIAGVLAGFALLAILLPLDHEASAEHSRASQSVVIFTGAFFSLLILAFNYAVLSGRDGETPQALAIAAHEQFMFGAVFGLSTILLLFGLRAVLSSYSQNAQVFAAARNVMLVVIALLAPIVALSLQFSNSLDIEGARIALASEPLECGALGLPNGIWINLFITLAGFTGVIAVALLRNRLPHSLRSAVLISYVTLGFTVVATVWTSVVAPLIPVELLTSSIFEHVALGFVAIAATLISAAAWTAR